MLKKGLKFQPIGLSMDSSPAMLDSKYATFLKNIRLVSIGDSGNLTLSLEKTSKNVPVYETTLVLYIENNSIRGFRMETTYDFIYGKEKYYAWDTDYDYYYTKTLEPGANITLYSRIVDENGLYTMKAVDTVSIKLKIDMLQTAYTFAINILGSLVINNNLIVFATDTLDAKKDYIYKFELLTIDGSIAFVMSNIYNGKIGKSLNFSVNNPILSIGVYENEDIQKVYWIDGINPPRMANINKDYTDNPQSLEFAPLLQLGETVRIGKSMNGGAFPQGTILYAFNYFNKFGLESNIAYLSPINYLSYNKGVAENETVHCSFNIYIDNVDPNFEYLRLYSIIRTTANATPQVKKVADIPLQGVTSVSFLDTGLLGETIDPVELLYIGGEDIIPETFEHKDGVLFFGNYKLNTPNFNVSKSKLILSALEDYIRFSYKTVEYSDLSNYSSYEGLLAKDASEITTFKYLEWYGVGIQFQYKNGKFSNPIYIKSILNTLPPVQNTNSFEVALLVIDLQDDSGSEKQWNLNGLIDKELWPKCRVVIVKPEDELRTVLCLGIVSSTVFNILDRYNNTPFAQSSWMMRPIGGHYNLLSLSNSTLGEILANCENFPVYYSASSAHTYKEEQMEIIATLHYTRYETNQNAYYCWTISWYLEGAIKYYSDKTEYKHFSITKVLKSSDVDGAKAMGYKKGKPIYWTPYPPDYDNGKFIKDTWDKLVLEVYDEVHPIAGEYLEDGTLYLDMLDYVTKTSYKLSDYLALFTGGLGGDKYFKAKALNMTGSEGITYKYNDVITIEDITKQLSNFYIDESILTLNSPDFLLVKNQIDSSSKFRVIGIIKSNNLLSNFNITARSSRIDGFINGSINAKFTNIKSNLLWLGHNYNDITSGTKDSKKYFWATYIWHRGDSLSNYELTSKKEDDTGDSTDYIKQISNTRIGEITYLKGSNIWKPISVTSKIIDSNDVNYYLINAYNTNTDKVVYSGNVNKVYSSNFPIYYYPVIASMSSTTSLIASGKAKYLIWNSGNTLYGSTEIKYLSSPHIVLNLNGGKTTTESELALTYNTEILPLLYTERVLGISTNITNKYLLPTDCTGELLWNPNINTNTYTIGNNGVLLRRILVPVNWEKASKNVEYYYIGELYRTEENPYTLIEDTLFTSSVNFIPAGDITDSDAAICIGDQGDTYFMRWDCLKTYPFSSTDQNQYIDITSFMVESRTNIDGRYDNQRGLYNNLSSNNTNFNLINGNYTLLNTYFNYNLNYISTSSVNRFPNLITWTPSKNEGEAIDTWTKITLLNTHNLDGDKGEITSINRYNNELYCFLNNGLSRLMYNSRAQISTSDGVPIEISTGTKMQGHIYISNLVGCQNKFSITSTGKGLYFVDNNSSDIYLLNELGLKSLSDGKVFKWIKHVPSTKWTYHRFALHTLYDNTTGDVYFIVNNIPNDNSIAGKNCLAFNEFLNEFLSFYPYSHQLYFENIGLHCFVINSEGIQELHAGDLYYGGYQIDFIANDNFDLDKIYECIEFRSNDIPNITRSSSTGKQISSKYPFTNINIENEYLSGIATNSSLLKKFRTWRWQLPRNNNCDSNKRDRIRNPWAKISLQNTNSNPTDLNLEIYDIITWYYI